MRNQFQSQRFSVNCASTSSPSTQNINLLLLGKSGVGKSMFINAFGNYKMYKNMSDIKSLQDIEISVPMAFEMSDDAFNIKQFVIGEKTNTDENENLKFNAASATHGCKSYKYQFEDTTVNLIDTPGLVDTDGVDKDKENMDAILSFIGQYKYINGICLVLHPDEERLNDVFKYCINELLCQLDHTAASNIIWIFTKAAATLYRVGSTSRAIKLMIAEIRQSKPELNIPFEQKNCFLFDNVSFKYLVARDQITFSEDDIQSFNDSWNRSLRESVRMIRHVADLKPYDVQASLLIYRTRELINGLLPQMKEITRNIIENEEILRQKTYEVANFEGSMDELKKILFIESIKLKTSHHNGPRIVCKSPVCRKETFADGNYLISYPQICYSSDTPLKEWISQMRDIVSSTGAAASVFIGGFGVIGIAAAAATGLAVCAALLGYGGYWLIKKKCDICSCANFEHSINYYEINEVKERIKDPDIEQSLQMATSAVDIKKKFLKDCETRIDQLEKAKRVIDEANGTFAVFLKQRAIVPYSDAYPAYLKLLIKDAESLKDGAVKAQRLKETLTKYEELKYAIENPSLGDSTLDNKCVSLLQIDNIVKKLMVLPIYGPEIKDTLLAMKNIHINYRLKREDDETPNVRRVSAIF